jgi:hypothetical protein
MAIKLTDNFDFSEIGTNKISVVKITPSRVLNIISDINYYEDFDDYIEPRKIRDYVYVSISNMETLKSIEKIFTETVGATLNTELIPFNLKNNNGILNIPSENYPDGHAIIYFNNGEFYLITG